jgi:hypothetical protein
LERLRLFNVKLDGNLIVPESVKTLIYWYSYTHQPKSMEISSETVKVVANSPLTSAFFFNQVKDLSWWVNKFQSAAEHVDSFPLSLTKLHLSLPVEDIDYLLEKVIEPIKTRLSTFRLLLIKISSNEENDEVQNAVIDYLKEVYVVKIKEHTCTAFGENRVERSLVFRRKLN